MAAGPPPTTTTTSTPVPDSTPPTPETKPAVEAPEGAPQSQVAAAGASNADRGTGLNDQAYQAELKRAREEAAGSRAQLAKFKRAFEGYDDEQLDQALAMYASLRDDPKQAFKTFSQTVENIKAHLREMGEWEDEDDGKSDSQSLSMKDVEKFLDKRDRKKAEDEAVREVLAEAKALGYKDDDGPESWKHAALLWTANKTTGGDLKKAHEHLQAHDKAVGEAAVKAYIESLNKPKYPPASGSNQGGSNAPAASGDQKPAEKFDAKKSALARLAQAGFTR